MMRTRGQDSISLLKMFHVEHFDSPALPFTMFGEGTKEAENVH